MRPRTSTDLLGCSCSGPTKMYGRTWYPAMIPGSGFRTTRVSSKTWRRNSRSCHSSLTRCSVPVAWSRDRARRPRPPAPISPSGATTASAAASGCTRSTARSCATTVDGRGIVPTRDFEGGASVVGIVALLTMNQPATRPPLYTAVGAERAGRDQSVHRAGHLLGPESEEARQQSLAAEDRAPRVALDQLRHRALAGEPPPFRHRLRQPRLHQVPAVRERRLAPLFGLDHPEPLLELGHRPLELARLRGLEHERVGPQPARVLRVLSDQRVHQAACRVRHPPRGVLPAVVARPLPPAGSGVEGGKELEGHQQRPALEKLSVVHAFLRRERVLQLPREPDGRVVVRAPRPAR